MHRPEIIFEDKDIIVCNKPAGMATQTKHLGQQDMESFLKNYRASKKEEPYIGVVHRLDQPVEGVMVFAKNPKAAAALSKQVQQRIIGKHYYAVCTKKAHEQLQLHKQEQIQPQEQIEELSFGDTGTLTDYILTDKKNNISKVVWPEDANKNPQAKMAVLDYRVIKQEQDKIVFDITLHTGRQHQIRLQLSNMGYPIIGDKKYGGIANDKLMLCSYRIEFEHPVNGAKMDYKIDSRFLDNLGILA